MSDPGRIRNFSIIAHIDHGKSTLADRILELTGALSKREMQSQFLDKLSIERERGITVKAQTVRLNYKDPEGNEYIFNLIDTPGHVDFGYEVAKSLQACEGALLVVDASQGVEAQTLANVFQAVDANLELFPVLNKIDLPGSDVEKTKAEIEDLVGIPADEAIGISAKEGTNVDKVLVEIAKRFPPPKGDKNAPLQALLFDAWFDSYQGVVILVRVMNGTLKPEDRIRMMQTGKTFEVLKIGAFTPVPKELPELSVGEVGFIVANIKDLHDVKIGDTVTLEDQPSEKPLPGFKEVKPMVFSGIYPVDSSEYAQLKIALEKLSINDSSFTFEAESSDALGFGFRCGFLGLLHMEIVQERLEREFNVELVTTAPTVVFRVNTVKGESYEIYNPSKLPKTQDLVSIEEPIARVTIHTPEAYLGAIIKLCEDRRGKQVNLRYHSKSRIVLDYDLPFSEMVLSFYDKVKSVSRGYASMDYEVTHYEPADLVKLDLLINGDPVDALGWIVHRDKSYYRGRDLCVKMKEFISRQMFEVVIQAAIGSKIIAKTRVAPLRKNVTAKCYGGDISRKRKLLEKQKEGKRRMKQVGNVEIPQKAFLAVLKVD